MRRLLFATLLATAACNLSPPCQQVAKITCDMGTEGDSCAFLLRVEKGDDHTQSVCKGILGRAKAVHAAPGDAAVVAAWEQARAELVTVGMKIDWKVGKSSEKLKAAGGEAGKLVDKVERIMENGERDKNEAAERAFDAVGH